MYLTDQRSAGAKEQIEDKKNNKYLQCCMDNVFCRPTQKLASLWFPRQKDNRIFLLVLIITEILLVCVRIVCKSMSENTKKLTEFSDI